MSPEHPSLLHVSCLCVACVSVWSWLALQFALQDLKTALIAMHQVYTYRLYGAVWYTASVCVCVCVRACVRTCVRACVCFPDTSSLFARLDVLGRIGRGVRGRACTGQR